MHNKQYMKEREHNRCSTFRLTDRIRREEQSKE